MAATLSHVEVTTEPHGLVVTPVYAGVDRPRTGGIALPGTLAGSRLAARLQRALEAGAANPVVGIRADVNGETFAATRLNVMGRTLNADLKRLGF